MDRTIIISRCDTKLDSIVRENNNIKFIYFGTKNPKIVELLKQSDAKEILIDFTDESFNAAYVTSYLDLVGRLGQKYNSMVWWATFTASKNKFVSRLLPDLFNFIGIIKIIKNVSDQDILIINPPESIVSSLKKYCIRNSIAWTTTSSPKVFGIAVLEGIFLRYINKVHFIVSVWAKICIARYYFKNLIRNHFNPHERYYILRTWLYDRSIDDQQRYHDSFFGILPDYLRKNKNLVIIAGIIGNYLDIAKKAKNVKDHLIIPQEYFLDYGDPLWAVLSVRKNMITLDEKIEFMGNDVTDIIQNELRRDFYNFVPGQYLYSFWARRMQNTFSVDTFTTTYENNPWEKVIFLTLRQYNGNIKIYGYQHAVLAFSSLNMFLSRYEKNIIPLPDKVITIGKITRDLLEKTGNYPPEIIREGCGLRFVQTLSPEHSRRRLQRTVLVAPEGGLSESVNLVNFVFSALKDSQNLKVIIRSHPELPFEKYRKYLNSDIMMRPHFSLSEHISIRDDLDISDILIYRGSSVAIEALKTGLAIIYVKLQDIVSVDPIFDNHSLKWIIKDENELKNAIEEIFTMNKGEYEKKLHEAHDYLKKYFYEVNDERLKEFT